MNLPSLYFWLQQGEGRGKAESAQGGWDKTSESAHRAADAPGDGGNVPGLECFNVFPTQPCLARRAVDVRDRVEPRHEDPLLLGTKADVGGGGEEESAAMAPLERFRDELLVRRDCAKRTRGWMGPHSTNDYRSQGAQGWGAQDMASPAERPSDARTGTAQGRISTAVGVLTMRPAARARVHLLAHQPSGRLAHRRRGGVRPRYFPTNQVRGRPSELRFDHPLFSIVGVLPWDEFVLWHNRGCV